MECSHFSLLLQGTVFTLYVRCAHNALYELGLIQTATSSCLKKSMKNKCLPLQQAQPCFFAQHSTVTSISIIQASTAKPLPMIVPVDNFEFSVALLTLGPPEIVTLVGRVVDIFLGRLATTAV